MTWVITLSRWYLPLLENLHRNNFGTKLVHTPSLRLEAWCSCFGRVQELQSDLTKPPKVHKCTIKTGFSNSLVP
jgi:hypothetical protein